MPNDIPLSLYIHLPWCEKKCPYCDFNSHVCEHTIPKKHYIDTLIKDLDSKYQQYGWGREIYSIFIGGGTPSLFAGQHITYLLQHIFSTYPTHPKLEATIETNPNSLDEQKIEHYKKAGINRLSIGVQSFNNECLKALGRTHNQASAIDALKLAEQFGMDEVNGDLMYGLPKGSNTQSIEQCLDDIQQLTDLKVTHISLYELTLEPNTHFFKHPPILPKEDHLFEMAEQGQQMLQKLGFEQYEVSSYGNKPCQHNLNYWQFGDYLGIGAGAHSKVSNPHQKSILRLANKRSPKQYLNSPPQKNAHQQIVDDANRAFEFMLNALRLKGGFTQTLFENRTFLPFDLMQKNLQQATEKGLLIYKNKQVFATPLGWRFLNELQALFLPAST